jgi:syntaxin-binding protein 1
MKDMLASLPQYQEQREKVREPIWVCAVHRSRLSLNAQFSLHLSMAQECMDIFERDKLPVVATVEQVCSSSRGGRLVFSQQTLELFDGGDIGR